MAFDALLLQENNTDKKNAKMQRLIMIMTMIMNAYSLNILSIKNHTRVYMT